MKLDKDTLLKNIFWIVLGTAAFFTLIGWGMMLILVPGAVTKQKAKVEKAWKEQKTYNMSNHKHKDYVKQMQEEAKELQGERANLHLDLYNAQAIGATVMTWPKKMGKYYDFKNGKYALEVKILPMSKNKDDPFAGLPAEKEGKEISGILMQTQSEYFTIKARVEDKEAKKEAKKETKKDGKKDGKKDAKKDTKREAGQETEVLLLRTVKIKVTDQSNQKDKITTFGDLGKRENYPVVVTYITGKYFGEELTKAEIDAYRGAYKDQLMDILNDLGAVNELGKDEIQLRYTGKTEQLNECWIYNKNEPPPPDNRFFSYAPTMWNENVKAPESDEVWAAQENMWVQRELYRQLKAVNDSVAVCERVMPAVEVVIQHAGTKLAVSNDAHVPGTLTGETGKDWFNVRDQGGQTFHFMRTAGIKITEKDAAGKSKPVPFEKLSEFDNRLVVVEFAPDKDGQAKFRNFYWTLDVKTTNSGVEVRLFNLRPNKQSIDDLHFLVRFKVPSSTDPKRYEASDPVLFPPKGSFFEGDQVGPAGGGNDVFPARDKPAKSFALPGVSITELYSVEQVLTVDTAAVKRIDVVNVAAALNGEMAVSQRHGLKSFVYFNKPKAPPAPSKAAAGAGAGAPPPPVPAAADPVEPQLGPDGEPLPKYEVQALRGDVAKKFTKDHKLLLERYLDVTDASRKLPVNLVLVVGPEHTARVQAFLISSPLRFLETQVFMQRAQLIAGSSSDTPGPKKAGTFSPTPKTPAPAAGGSGGGGGDSLENIEMTIFAVITLYDRPDRPDDKKRK